MGRSDGSILGVTRIVNNGPRRHRFNIVILGDGFRESEQPLFNAAVQNMVNKLFSFAPFSNGVKYAINVFRVNVASLESGANDPVACDGSGAAPRTFFDGSFCNSGIQRLTSVDDGLAFDVARTSVPQVHAVIVLLNSTIWGGSGGSVATCSMATGADNIAIHELGHSVFGLADEYEYYEGCGSGETGHDSPFLPPIFDLVEPNVTHFTDSFRLGFKWLHFINTTPIPTTRNADCTICDPQPNRFPIGTVGLFEGAKYFHCGIFRPEFNCMMRNSGNPFCKVCIDQIQRKLAPFMPNFNLLPNVFDVGFYLNQYPDLQAAFGANNTAEATNHWLQYGIKEGRRSSPAFDVSFYLHHYPDLQAAFGANNYAAAINHWLQYGINESRRSSPAFDVGFYLNQYPDLQAAFGANNYAEAINHWLRNGINEGRRSSPAFDVSYYLNNYPDLKAAFGANNYAAAINHWLQYGIKEGRRSSPAFDVSFYLNHYADLKAAFGANNYAAAINHWLQYGINEGRKGSP